MNEPTIAELKAEIEALKFRILMLEAQRICHHGDYWWQWEYGLPQRDDGWGRSRRDPWDGRQYEWCAL